MEKLKLKNWIVVASSRNLYIFNLNKKLNGNLSIRNTINIEIDLTVKVFDEVNGNIVFNLKLYRWQQLQRLFEQFNSNVKREDDLDIECVMMEKRPNSDAVETVQGGFGDCNENEQKEPFEFFAINALADVGEQNTLKLCTFISLCNILATRCTTVGNRHFRCN